MGLDELRLTCIKGSKMPKNERRGEEIDALIQFTADVPIFNKEIVPGNEEHKQICMHLTHLKVPAEETIYTQGEMGDKFYIVINGSVSVYMTNEELEEPGEPILQEILTTGGSFGEECLVDNNDPRRNTVITRTNCDLLMLDREDYEKATHYKVQEELRKKLLVVDQIYPFQTLSAVNLKTLALVMTRKRYKYNDVIFQENYPANAMYFVVKGQVRIVKAIVDNDVRQVEPVFLELCIDGPLTYFGESKRFASALCASPDCELLELVRYDFMKNIIFFIFSIFEFIIGYSLILISDIVQVSHELLCMLREQAKFYPTYDEIMKRYKEIKKWNEYKTAVVDEAEKDLKRKHKNANNRTFSTSPIRTNSNKKQPYFPITVNIKK